MPTKVMQPNLLPLKEGLRKSDIRKLVHQSVEGVQEGDDVLRLAEVLAAMEQLTKGIRGNETFVNEMRDVLARHGGRLTMPSGARIEACEAGYAYDYTNNPAWCYLSQQISELSAQQKELEQKLRQIAAGQMIVDEETGEVFSGPLQKSKSTYRITLAK